MPVETEVVQIGNLELIITGTEVNLELKTSGETILVAELGVALPPVLGQPVDCSDANAGDLCREWGSAARLSITPFFHACYDLTWTTNSLQAHMDCIDIDDGRGTKWFGGPEEYYQHFPMNNSFTREKVPYLPGDMLQDSVRYFGGVAEPYWLNSKGAAIWVPEGIPLFYSWNDNSNPGQMCFSAQNELPYIKDVNVNLSYRICSKADAKEMHMYAIDKFLGKPTGIPDEQMMTLPIWSSWAQYKADINESTILDFARKIHENGFEVSQIEIDDNWEVCYGDADFDTSDNKFPDPGGMINTIMDELGYKVTLWIHPFVNLECASWFEAAVPPKSYFVRDIKGKDGIGNLPGLVWWWQGVLAR